MQPPLEHAILRTYREACRLYSEEVYERNPPELSLESPFLAVAHAIRTAWPDVVKEGRSVSKTVAGCGQVTSLSDRRIEKLQQKNLDVLASADTIDALKVILQERSLGAIGGCGRSNQPAEENH